MNLFPTSVFSFAILGVYAANLVFHPEQPFWLLTTALLGFGFYSVSALQSTKDHKNYYPFALVSLFVTVFGFQIFLETQRKFDLGFTENSKSSLATNFETQFQHSEGIEWFANARKQFHEKIQTAFERNEFKSSTKGFIKAFLLGDSKNLDRDLKLYAKETGILHLFAASGLHLGILVAFLNGCLFFLGKKSRTFLVLGISFAYLYLLHFPISLTRAFLFLSLLHFGNLFFRKLQKSDLIVYTLFLIYLFSPKEISGISLKLSISAVIGIFFLKPKLDLLISIPSFLRDSFTLSLACSLSTFPVFAFYFQTFSFGSTPINFLLVPIASILFPYLLVFTILLGFGITHEWLIQLTNFLVESFVDSTIWFHQIAFYRNLDKFDAWVLMVCVCLVVLSLFCAQNFQKKWKLFSVICFLTLFQTIGIFFLEENPEQIQKTLENSIHFRSPSLWVSDGNCFLDRKEISKLQKTISCGPILLSSNPSCLKSMSFVCKQAVPILLKKNPTFQIRISEKTKLVQYFSVGKSDITKLQELPRTGTGNIVVLQFTQKNRDEIESWNGVQKELGIPSNWIFMDSKRFYELSTNDDYRNSRSPARDWWKRFKEMGTEFLDRFWKDPTHSNSV